MASYQRFEDLPVWQKAAGLAAEMFSWTTNDAFRGKGDLANQLQRAALSISNNIAEGFERGSTKELLQFLYIARGSAAEVRSMLCVMERMQGFSKLGGEITEMKSTSENISRQIRGWAGSLQNGDIEGQRHLNDQTKDRYQRKLRRERFDAEQAKHQRQLEERLKRKAEERTRESEI